MPTAKVTIDRSSRVFHPFTAADEMAERFKFAATSAPSKAELGNEDIIVLQEGVAQPDGTCMVIYADGRSERYDPMKVALEGAPFRQLLAELCRRPLRWIRASGNSSSGRPQS